MSDESSAIERVRYTPEFKRNLRQLARKYRRIRNDLQPLLDSLQGGETPGDQVPNVQYEVFKVRVANSDSGKGKSGGYRVIYQRDPNLNIILITLYSKSDQEDIAPHEIRAIILAYDSRAAASTDGTDAESALTGCDAQAPPEP